MDFTYSLAFADFIPVIIFLIVSLKLSNSLNGYMQKYLIKIFSASLLLIFAIGFAKAFMKVLFVAGVRSTLFEFISNTYYFPTLVTLFFLAGISICLSELFRHKSKFMMIFTGFMSVLFVALTTQTVIYFFNLEGKKMYFVILLIFGNLLLWGILSIIAFHHKCPHAGVTFLFTFGFLMGMGYMNSKDFTQASSHYQAEAINSCAHIFMLIATIPFCRKIKPRLVEQHNRFFEAVSNLRLKITTRSHA